ncbi:hypothetical protein AS9A_P20008 (plasmid) [Hoyosella subflava DQS3-9A1]|uniref:Uncharacterized protein n=1 Tax=Hoyosella subflava (strain DSM 45089 / JCM 17490 / NBRC 109087 / DQS3-9A1) TaxID=443218 RepID=F6ESD0_HOYSD|nr:hypothetical protein AS9A_P20008 [Hoyosella subflava DQS3-9A1]
MRVPPAPHARHFRKLRSGGTDELTWCLVDLVVATEVARSW